MNPLVFIIFGATGDLTARKLMPAMYSLYTMDERCCNIRIIGVGRRDLTQEAFKHMMRQAVPHDKWDSFAKTITYVQGNFEDDSLYTRLVSVLNEYDAEQKACIPRFFYLATPPDHYQTILTRLKSSTLSDGCGQGTINYTRVLIEKPFGKDLETARSLDQLLGTFFEEKQIYRIDHYLAKETVQNILAFRFANGIFEPTWNSEFIDHVQIMVAEEEGIQTRGNFYEGIGALRDVIQNHMMQMLSLVAMEQPDSFNAQSVRNKRTEVIQSIEPLTAYDLAHSVIRGQYNGYTKETGVSRQSKTETYAALRLFVQTPRWKGVPFYLRTGKKLGSKVTEISIHYKKPALCNDDVCLFDPKKVFRNVLTIRVTPNESITLRLMIKQPGYKMNVTPVYMNFRYAHDLPDIVSLDAYETLLLDAIGGDQMLFARTDEIDASWQVVKPILDHWNSTDVPLLPYEPGSLGPEEADMLIQKEGRKWYLHEK